MDLSLLVCFEGWALQEASSKRETKSALRGTTTKREPIEKDAWGASFFLTRVLGCRGASDPPKTHCVLFFGVGGCGWLGVVGWGVGYRCW